MRRLLAFRRNHRETRSAAVRPIAQLLRVPVPDLLSPGLDPVALLELRQQERGEELGGEVARSDVPPGVLVHLAAEEPRPVRSLLPDDLGALDQGGVVDEQRAPLPAGEVLRLVEALRGERAEGAQELPLVPAEEAVSVVFDDGGP